MLEVYGPTLRDNKVTCQSYNNIPMSRLFSGVRFDWCIIPHTTVCKLA